MMSPFSKSLFPAIAVVLALGSAMPCDALAGESSTTPKAQGVSRLMKLYHFEEAEEGNFEDMPRNWYVIGRGQQSDDAGFARRPLHQELLRRPGFPAYATVRFDQPQQRKGNHSLYLGINGGSAGAFLEIGALPAVPESDYVITARVRTTALRHARARLSAYFVDSEGRRIDASVTDSGLLATGEQWQSISLKLTGDFPRAAWIGMQAELLQARHQSPVASDTPRAATEKHHVDYQEVTGGAWFDDVAVWQVPRIVLRTQSKVNVIVAPAKPQLSVEVRDLTGQRLAAVLSVYDHRGSRVAQAQRMIGDGDTSTWDWTPALPALGWYVIDLELTDPSAVAGDTRSLPAARTIRAFLWTPQRTRVEGQAAARFTLDLHGAPLEELVAVPELMSSVGLSSVLLDAWDRSVTEATLEARLVAMDRVMQPLLKQNVDVALCLSPVPNQLVDRLSLNSNDPLWLFRQNRTDWMAYLAPVLLRHGQHVRRWQFGQPGQTAGFTREQAPLAQGAIDALAALTPDPRAVFPWSAAQPRRPLMDEKSVEYAIDMPQSVQPRHMADYLREWIDSPPARFSVHLPSTPATQMRQSRRIDDLAVRMLHLWELRPQGISIPRPWATLPDARSMLHPDPLLGVFATVSRQLEGRQVVGRLDLGPGLVAMILDGPRGGMLAAWAEGELEAPATVSLYLGEKISTCDVWGNRATLEEREGKQSFALTATPIFIEGIDAKLALLRASFAVTPTLIESSQVAHEHTLTLGNPWPHALQGDLIIVEPGRDWRIEPRRISVNIEPGGTFKLPIRIGLPVSETAGPKLLKARFEFSSIKHPPLELTAAMELGLADLRIDTAVVAEKNDRTGQLDAVVTLFITNTGEQKRTMNVFASMPGEPRHERTLSLRDGQSVIRKFRFEGAGMKLKDHAVRVGLRDTAGPILLSQVIEPSAGAGR